MILKILHGENKVILEANTFDIRVHNSDLPMNYIDLTNEKEGNEPRKPPFELMHENEVYVFDNAYLTNIEGKNADRFYV